MNYRHAYHAGNFADVLKHAVLTAVLLHLRKKDKPFAVIDTHAGRGLYDLKSGGALKTAEAETGIRRILGDDSPPGVLGPYLDIVRGFGPNFYPGSPLIAANLLRPQDRLVAIEKLEEEYRALATNLAATPQARVVLGDGYEELKQLMPPKERRGAILVDPPYEEPGEFATATRALIAAHRRFPTGIFLFWYPAKEQPAVGASAGELVTAGVKSLLRVELDVGAPPNPVSDHGGTRLTATGLLVVNAPWGFSAQVNTVLPYLARRLQQGPGVRFTLERLAGEDR
jgi:23S rRNA (adenine2030-N6)-methyltransferase